MNKFWSKYQKQLLEWHPTKNGGFTPNEVFGRTSEKVWWKCKEGPDHEWEAKIVSRTSGGRGCPFCAGKQVSVTNSLQSLHPTISTQWHPRNNGNLSPSEVVATTTKKAWWKCEEGPDHEWEVEVRKRTIRGYGCPFCSSRRLSKTNNLQIRFPLVAAEWDTDRNAGLRPQDIVSGSMKKMWWVCPKKHSYQMSLNNRTVRGWGCPFCAGKRVSEENSLKFLYPDIAAEWHPSKNGGSQPTDFTGASSKIVWWACPRGHSYSAHIKSRTLRGDGCPLCSHHSSAPEIRLFTELKNIFNEVEYRKRIDGIEVDIFVPDPGIAIEYDGSYYHRDIEGRDLKKNKFLNSKGIEIIRVRHRPLKKITKNDLIVESNEISKSDVNGVVKKLIPLVGEAQGEKIDRYLQKNSFTNEKLFREYLIYTRSTLPDKSLACLFPGLALEWHNEKNDPLKPENFPPGSHQKVWWKCANGHEFYSMIKGRTGKNARGCPECSGNKVGRDNNLLKRFPEIAAEWHPTKNLPKLPTDFTHGSKQKVWWLCPKGHHYFSQINNRTSVRKAGCPLCRTLSRKRNVS